MALTRSKSALYIVGQPDWFKVKDKDKDTATSSTSTETSDDNIGEDTHELATSTTAAFLYEASRPTSAVASTGRRPATRCFAKRALETSVAKLETQEPLPTVNSLQLKSNIDADYVMTLISELDFSDKCKLFALFNDELTQEKWSVVTEALKDDAARSDRAIASTCNTSTPFVSKVRKNLLESNEIEAEITRVDKRGRKHKFFNTSK